MPVAPSGPMNALSARPQLGQFGVRLGTGERIVERPSGPRPVLTNVPGSRAAGSGFGHEAEAAAAQMGSPKATGGR